MANNFEIEKRVRLLFYNILSTRSIDMNVIQALL
jgi:hypothetical protein